MAKLPPKKTRIDLCPECQSPYDSLGGVLSRCTLCTSNRLSQQYHEEDKHGLAAYFETRPERDDPNWQESIEQGEPMDMAWRLIKGDI